MENLNSNEGDQPFASHPLTTVPRILLIAMLVVRGLAFGQEHATLLIRPSQVSLHLNGSVAFSAARYDRRGKFLPPKRVAWQAYSLTSRHTASISPLGVFTGSVAGDYRITAKVGSAQGYVNIRVLPGVPHDPNEQPSKVTTVSSRANLGHAATAVLHAPRSGREWWNNNFQQMFQIENRRGRDLLRRNSKNRRLRNVDGGIGKGNYLLTVPLLNLKGRSLNVSLSLFYQPKNWLKMKLDEGEPGNSLIVTHMIFDHDNGWPAPGWSLGFGKIIQVPSGAAVEDADGTLHPFGGQFEAYAQHEVFKGHTTDGTLIDYSVDFAAGAASVSYPNGTIVNYGADNTLYPLGDDIQTFYPIRITDVNGNFITITYVNNKGPQIQAIQDTLGRIINFHYDSANQLTAITAPGLNGGIRTIVRLHYFNLSLPQFGGLGKKFETDLGDPTVPARQALGVDGIYFPGTSTGYWFGDSDSYSYYGMIAKVSQRRAMTIQSTSLDDQGTLTPGTATHERVYGYQLTKDLLLTDAPTYSKMTEWWEGMDSSLAPAVTQYTDHLDANPRRLDTVYPDGTQVSQEMYNDPNQWDDGLLFRTITKDPKDTSGRPLREVKTSWEQGDYDSPRITAVESTDSLGQTSTIQYTHSSPTNQLSEVRQLDYDRKTVLRSTHTDYETNSHYAERHIFNLPQRVTLNGLNDLAHVTEYKYDDQLLINTPGAVGLVDICGPLGAACPTYDYRGNITQIVRYSGYTRPVVGTGELTGPVIEVRQYDIAGNLVNVSGTCCEQITISYTSDTQFAYPSSITRGATDPASTARVVDSFTYDFDTGMVLTSTNPNGLTTTTAYDDGSLRPTRLTSPTSAFVDYEYDDAGMSITQSVLTPTSGFCGPFHLPCKPGVAAKTVTQLNGLGLAQRVETLTDGNVWNAVSMQYDSLGRGWKRSQPYQLPQQPSLWTVMSYDSLGRVTTVQTPDGSQTGFYYNEPNRPSSASKTQGQSLRVVPPYGGDRWFRNNALGQLAEVVEPAPGSDTTYSYNALGLLVRALQGPDYQERRFLYDLLGRLTAESLPERTGASGPLWTDTFSYDDHSNLTSRTDPRGVVTTYDYAGDPLDRLQQVSYQSLGRPDSANPILPSPSVMFKYMGTGDVRRVSQVSTLTANGLWAVQDNSYDSEERLASKKLSFVGFPAFETDYSYNILNQLTGVIYPVEFGIGAQPRKKSDYSYGPGGSLRDVRIDGTEYASQFAYNSAGQATSISVGPAGSQQTTEVYKYDPATELLTSQQVLRGGSPLLGTSGVTYTYFPDGQLKDRTEDTGDYQYTYDALGRLTSLNAAPQSGPPWTESYGYDPYGNRTSVGAAGQINGSPVPLDGLPSLTYDTTTNHVTTPGFLYDAAGNQTRSQRADGSWLRYQYDQAGRLAQVTDDAGNVIESYKYGTDGKRVATTTPSGSTYFVWDGNNVIAEYTQSANPPSWNWSKSRIYLGNRILASFVPSTSGELVYYHHPDRLGTRLITNSADNTSSEQVTLPFGTLLPGATSNPINPIFTTYDRSSATALDYAINRDYDPQQRFTQADPIGLAAANLRNPQSLNLYGYVGDDPINSTDLVGLQADAGTGPSLSQQGKAICSQVAADCTLLACAAAPNPLTCTAAAAQEVKASIEMSEAFGPPPTGIGPWSAPYLDFGISAESYTIQSTTSINNVVESMSPLTYVTVISEYSSNPILFPTQQTTITATNSPDGSSQVTIQSPDGTTTVRDTDAQGNQTTTVYDSNGNQVSSTTVDINGDPVGTGTTEGDAGGCTPQPSSMDQPVPSGTDPKQKRVLRGGRGRILREENQPCQ